MQEIIWNYFLSLRAKFYFLYLNGGINLNFFIT